MLTFSINLGILMGFIISTHVDYFVIPCIVIVLPLIFLILAYQLPETPQQLLRKGNREQMAEESYRYYSKKEKHELRTAFLDLQQAVAAQKNLTNTVGFKDFGK